MPVRTRIFLLIAAVLLLTGGAYAYFQLRQSEIPSRDPLQAIPNSAFCLIGSENVRETWEKLNQGNLIWAAMGETEWAAAVSKTCTEIDSLLNADKETATLFENRRCWISFHCTGKDDFDFVLASSLPSPSDMDDFSVFFKKHCGEKKITESEWNDSRFITADEGKPNSFTLALREGIILLSGNKDLLKAGISQLEKEPSLLQDNGFLAVKQTAGEKSTANIYIHYPRLTTALKRIAEKDQHEQLDDIALFAGWSELDVSLRPNALLLNGYTVTGDSLPAYLATVAGQQPQPVEADQVLPANTICYASYGISNIELYLKKYTNWLEQTGTNSSERVSKIAGLAMNYHYADNGGIAGWLGNEIAFAEIPSENGMSPVALLSTNNTALAKKYMAGLHAASDSVTQAPPDSAGYFIRKVGAPEFLPLTFGKLFSELRESYYTVIKQYIVFAADETILRELIIANENKNTLINSSVYIDFRTNMSNEASLSFYAAPGRTGQLLETWATDAFAAGLKKHKGLLKRFDGIVLQYSSGEKNLFYTNLFLRHNPQGKKDISTLWETQLDTTFSGRPWLVKNHKTKGLDIFLQDDANTIYLISSTGTVFWKRKLNEKIIGDVQQIDALKNGKLQLVFNTSSSLYVIDRNGNDLAPFPVKFPAKATNAVRVFDYENTRDYRMLVACADKRIYNYTVKGQMVDGWKKPQTSDLVLAQLQHTVVAGKDYLIAADRSGKTCITDRQGAIRLNLKEELNPYVKQIFIENGKDLSHTLIISCDSLGNISRLSLSDELERIHFRDFQETPGFEYYDLDGDNQHEFIFLDTKNLMAFHEDKTAVMSFVFDMPVVPDPVVFAFSTNDLRIGVFSAQENAIHLVNKGGADTEGFPLPGNTAFSIGKLNGEGNYTLVCGNNGKYLCAYPMR